MNIIEFPKLGISLDIDPVIFSFGKINVYWYGVFIAIAFVLAVIFALRDSKKFGVDEETLIDAILFAAPVAIIFSRLYYVVFSWSEFKDNPSEIFKIWHGGLAIYGAIIGAFLTTMVFCKIRKLNMWKMFDIAAPYILMAQAIGRWGNFINQEAFGGNTSLPWGMTGNKIASQLKIYQIQGINVDPALPVHPTFLYESLWNFAAFGFLLWFRKHKKLDGEVTFLYMVLYGFGRFWIEGLRLDSLWLGPFRISQLLAAVFVVAFSALIYFRRKRFESLEVETAEIGSSEYGNILRKLNEETDSIVEDAAEDFEETEDRDTGSLEDADEAVEEETCDLKDAGEAVEDATSEKEDTGEAGESEAGDSEDAGEADASETGDSEDISGAGESEKGDSEDAGEADTSETGNAENTVEADESEVS